MANIVHFGKYYSPDYGGVENATAVAAEGAVAAGHRVSVICFKARDSYKEFSDSFGVDVIRMATSAKLASQPLSLRYFFHTVIRGRRADIIHLHAPNILAALSVLFIGRKPKLLVHWHSDVRGKGFLGKIVSIFEHAMLKRADCIVCTSEPYARSSQRLKRYVEKTFVIPLGIKPTLAYKPDEKLPKHIKCLIHAKRLVLSVGRLVPYKGFSYLIEATRLFPDDVIVIITGTGPLMAALSEKIKEENLEGRIHLFGRASHAELKALFNAARLFCLPSTDKSEAFGVAIIEAMSYGVPIVATEIDGSGVPWVNQHEISGLNVPPCDPAALAKACIKILDCSQTHQAYSKGAVERFYNNFTEEQYVTRLNEAYKTLINL